MGLACGSDWAAIPDPPTATAVTVVPASAFAFASSGTGLHAGTGAVNCAMAVTAARSGELGANTS